LISRCSHQAYPGKEEQQPDDTHYRKGGKMRIMLYNAYAGIDQSGNTQ